MKKLKCVLLIDDDPIANYVNKSLLEKMAVTEKVLSAVNGAEGIKILKGKMEAGTFPELIILDINMPVMSGIEFLESYKQLAFENKDATKVVMLTTSNHPRDLEYLKELPADDYLNKPLTAAKITDMLQRNYDSEAGPDA